MCPNSARRCRISKGGLSGFEPSTVFRIAIILSAPSTLSAQPSSIKTLVFGSAFPSDVFPIGVRTATNTAECEIAVEDRCSYCSRPRRIFRVVIELRAVCILKTEFISCIGESRFKRINYALPAAFGREIVLTGPENLQVRFSGNSPGIHWGASVAGKAR